MLKRIKKKMRFAGKAGEKDTNKCNAGFSLIEVPMDVMCRECQRWLSEPLQIKLGKKREKTQMPLQVNKFMELPSVSVKDMPVHDPDAELLSLILTIPSWQSSINRVKGAVDLRETSQETRFRLIDGLVKLNTTVFLLIFLMQMVHIVLMIYLLLLLHLQIILIMYLLVVKVLMVVLQFTVMVFLLVKLLLFL